MPVRPITFVPRVTMVPIGHLKAAAFNPERRTDDEERLGELETAIQEVGGILQPIIVSNDYMIGDGHRRWQAAKNLNYAEVPVIVTPFSLQVLWRVLNASTMPVKSRDWVEAHYRGMDIANLPVGERRKITEIKRLVGDDGFAMLAEHKMATSALDEARRVAKYIEGKTTERTYRATDDMVRRVLLWMVKLGQQTPARHATANKMNPKGLLYFVDNDLELQKPTPQT